MSYFDVNDDAHLNLLPHDLRQATDLELLAEECEADVIRAFRRPVRAFSYAAPGEWSTLYGWRWFSTTGQIDLAAAYPALLLGDGQAVFLNGYALDPTDLAEDDPFLLAMRRTIAGVIVWRLRQGMRDTASTAQSAERSSKTWRPGHDAPMPPHWDRWLRDYDTRPPAWGM